MADKKISELTGASTITGSEEIPVVQSATTVKASVDDIKTYTEPIAVKKAQKYLSPITITAEDGLDVDLGDSSYDDSVIIKLSWTGGSGTASNNTNRFIRFISDDSFQSNTHVDLTPASGQTLDGSSNKYRINKSYEGIAVWSDGTEWFIIQKKA